MATAPDTTLVTGPNFQQQSLGNASVTPTGGTQATMGDMLSGVATIPALKVTTMTVAGLTRESVQAGITAGTTQTIAGGTKVTSSVVTVTTVGTAGDAVTLPAASASTVGQAVWIFNSGAKAASIFPGESGTKIDGGSAGAAVTLTNTKNAHFIQTDSTNWISAQGGTTSA